MITEAARDGDAFALEQLAELGSWLGEGIASLTAVLDPAVVAIGGGVSEAGDLLLDPVRAAFAGQPARPRAPAARRDPPGRARQPGRHDRRRRPGPAVSRWRWHRGRRRRHQGARRGRHVQRAAGRAPRAGPTPGRRVAATGRRGRARPTRSSTSRAAAASTAVGIAAAGFVDAAGARVMFAPHLPWRGEEVRARLAGALGHAVLLDNDATCAAHAEVDVRRGARRRRRGRRDPGHRHRRRASCSTAGCSAGPTAWPASSATCRSCPTGAPCECGGRGCWEQYSSGNALVRDARARLGDEPTVLADLCDGDPARLTGPMVTAAAADGDLVAPGGVHPGRRLARGRAGQPGGRASTPTSWSSAAACPRPVTGCWSPPATRWHGRWSASAHRIVPPVLRAALGPEAGADRRRRPGAHDREADRPAG